MKMLRQKFPVNLSFAMFIIYRVLLTIFTRDVIDNMKFSLHSKKAMRVCLHLETNIVDETTQKLGRIEI